MFPDEAVHPPEQPKPETPWSHLSPKFTIKPDHLEHIVSDVLLAHGGDMESFIQACVQEEVEQDEMQKVSHALEGIYAFLDSPPKDPDVENLKVIQEIDLGGMGIKDYIYNIFGTNEGDIVAVTEKRAIRFDKDGHLLFNKEIGINFKNLLYEPIHDAVFFIQRSTDRKTFSLHELNRNGDVSEPLYTRTHRFEVLADPEGDLLMVEDQPDTGTKISRFNPDDATITATYVYPDHVDHHGTYMLRGGILVLDRRNEAPFGTPNLDFFDTKTGIVKGMLHTDEIISLSELPNGMIVCNGSFLDADIHEKVSLHIIDPRTAQSVGVENTPMETSVVGMGHNVPSKFDILPSGKLLKIAYRENPEDNMGHYCLQTWDTNTGEKREIYTFREPPKNFYTTPDGKIVIQYWIQSLQQSLQTIESKILVLG